MHTADWRAVAGSGGTAGGGGLAARVALVRECLAASRRLTVLTSALVVAAGVLPVAFTVAAGVLVSAVTGADGSRVAGALAVAAAVYVVLQVVGPFAASAADTLWRAVDESLSVRLMRAVSAPRTIAHLEDAAVLDRVAQAQGAVTGNTPGEAVPQLVKVWTRRLHGLAALAVLSGFRWWLPAALAGGAAVSYLWRRRHWMNVTRVVFERTDELRHADYLRNLAIRPEAAKETQVFTLSPWLVRSYRDRYLATMEPVWRARRSGAVAAVGVAALLFAIEGAGLVLVVRAAVAGEVSLGAAVVFAQSVRAAYILGRFDMDDMFLEDGLASLRVLQSLEAAVPRVATAAAGTGRPADGLPATGIRFEGVTFRYPGQDRPVFDGLDLDIAAGQSLAIVGTNGAGKTTLVKLLARLYEVDGGRLTVDGVDVRDLDHAAWQRRVAAIFQDFVPYPVSARDNVAFGAVDAVAGGNGQVAAAARRAGALDLIERLPHGWDTVLNRQFTDGAELSGGEWQRVALARALYAVSAGAGVLVLDEPTASLDVRAEAALYDRFLDLTHGVTSIVVSHRFSTVRRAERIVVLEGGRVVEDGTHDALLAGGGRYAAMYTLQASRFDHG